MTSTTLKVADHAVSATTKDDQRDKADKTARPLGAMDTESLLVLKHAVNRELASR